MRDSANDVEATSPRLALVTETWPPEINGVAMTLSRLAAGLAARQWAVDVVRPRQRGETAAHAGQVLVAGLPIPGYAGLRFGLPAPRTLSRLWQRQRPDVVHVATEGPLGWSALKAARALQIPVTSTFHTNFQRYCSHYRLGLMRGVVMRHLRDFHNAAAYTMAPNRDISQMLREDGYRNVVTLGRGVDTRLFDPQRRSEALRAAWGASEEAPAVIYVGRLAPEKNLQAVQQAYAQIRRLQPAARMVWVGDGPELTRLKRQYPEQVFLGARTGEELAACYASADLFLFASLTETYGNVVAEAMASGLAVVAFDYAAAALHIRPGENGMLVAFGDTHAFCAAALQLARDGALRARLGAAARAAMLGQGWDAVAHQFERYLRAAMQGGAHGQ